MKRKMELDRIPSRQDSTDIQWAAIQAHSLTLAQIASAGSGRVALWQQDSRQGRRFTESLDFFAKRHSQKASEYIRKTSETWRGCCGGPHCSRE